jgi:exonuclease SbcD
MGGGERSAHTVFEYSLPATAFPPGLHYVALGHLHRAQALAAACPTWYAGSPLQLDFGETADVKSVNVVEATPGRPARVTPVPLRAGRRLRTVRGTLDELAARVQDFGEDFLRVEVPASATPGLADRVRELLPQAVDVRLVRTAPGAGGPGPEPGPVRLGRSPQELFREYLVERGDDDPRLLTLFGELLDEAHATDPA